MGVCALVNELNRLRKSSGDSIDSDKNFDDFKKYMHIRRAVEDDLKEILRAVNESSKKTLVLLCGSAGDGKSHMLSYLKNLDEEHLLSGYKIHNDATESSSPTKTAIETLNEVLDDFADQNIDADGKNLILAINLGVLNNFIESEYGKRFNKLRIYVQDRCILATRVVENSYNKDSSFQHVSFADYQLYTLSEDGAKSIYIQQMLKKIFDTIPENPFVNAYSNECSKCPLQKKCAVRYNFSFLQNENIQRYISDLLVMTIIKKKEILTTREILNYFYDITVPQNFSYSVTSDALSNTETIIKNFIKGITPELIFEQISVSGLMDDVREYDPVLYRDELGDDFAVEFYVSTDVTSLIKKDLEDTIYGEFLLADEMINAINIDKDIKSYIFKFLLRIRAMKTNSFNDDIYDRFVKTLFIFNSGRKKKLGELYNAVEEAFLQWCGTDSDNHPCLDQDNQQYCLYEKVDFEENLSVIPTTIEKDELQRFIPELRVGFVNEKTNTNTVLDIDFSLYQMISQLNSGYIHTTNDMNGHADFIGFVERMLKTGNAKQEVFIVSSSGEKSTLKKTKFGYKFEVIR